VLGDGGDVTASDAGSHATDDPVSGALLAAGVGGHPLPQPTRKLPEVLVARIIATQEPHVITVYNLPT
jgi:hypothetical protein